MITETPIPAFKPVSFLTDLHLFIEYCNDFYNIKTGMYPIAKRSEIIYAIGLYQWNTDEFVGYCISRQWNDCNVQVVQQHQ